MVFGNNTASDFEMLRAGIIAKYHVRAMLLFVMEAEEFSVTHERYLFRYG